MPASRLLARLLVWAHRRWAKVADVSADASAHVCRVRRAKRAPTRVDHHSGVLSVYHRMRSVYQQHVRMHGCLKPALLKCKSHTLPACAIPARAHTRPAIKLANASQRCTHVECMSRAVVHRHAPPRRADAAHTCCVHARRLAATCERWQSSGSCGHRALPCFSGLVNHHGTGIAANAYAPAHARRDAARYVPVYFPPYMCVMMPSRTLTHPDLTRQLLQCRPLRLDVCVATAARDAAAGLQQTHLQHMLSIHTPDSTQAGNVQWRMQRAAGSF